MRRTLLALPGLLALAAAVCGCPADPSGADAGQPGDAGVTRVGFLYVGPRADYGWTKSHEDGRQWLENYGQGVKTSYVENVPVEGAAAKIDELYAAGHRIVFTTSYSYLEVALDAPERHPDLWVLNCSGFKTARHVGNYMGRVEQAEYLTGMVAGAMTRTNKIGVVGAVRIYEQMMHINAFALGVRSVNPDAEVLVRWVGRWLDPALEAKAVQELVGGGGVDVIKGYTDSNVPILEADQTKTPAGATVWSIGHDNKDYCNNAVHGTCLLSSFFDWGPYYQQVVEEIAAGTYPEGGRIDYLGAEDLAIVGISPLSAQIPAEVAGKVLAKQEEITQGRFDVFQGPFQYDDGTPWKRAGEALTDQELVCTSRFVAGVKGYDGPACTKDADCGAAGALSCDSVRGLCQAPDLSGCGR